MQQAFFFQVLLNMSVHCAFPPTNGVCCKPPLTSTILEHLETQEEAPEFYKIGTYDACQ